VRIRVLLICLSALLLTCVASCAYEGPDAERFFSGRPSPYARALNGVLNETDEDFAAFLRVPSHVDLHGWYKETYQTDLNNVIRRRYAERFLRAYALLTPGEKDALKPYLAALDSDLSEMIGDYK